jgi:hypothetical protein
MGSMLDAQANAMSGFSTAWPTISSREVGHIRAPQEEADAQAVH